MWRRQHQEGPIDDRWTSLRLDEDECSGELRIVESRKEWYLGSSRSQVTYYTTRIIFPGSQDDQSDLASSLPTGQNPRHNDLSILPDDLILRLPLPCGGKPRCMRPPPRQPQNTHPSNEGSHEPAFTLAKSRIRHYHASASTYLALVNDPDPTDRKCSQRLRLRAGSRKLGPLLTHESGVNQGLLRPPSHDLWMALKEMYQEQPIVYWPPAQDLENPNEDLDAVYRLLNPLSHLGNVQGTADERSLVYVTGGWDEPQAIVFVSFDPVIKLVGLKRWGGLFKKGLGYGSYIDGLATEYRDENLDSEIGQATRTLYVDVEETEKMITTGSKGKGKAPGIPLVQVSGDTEVEADLVVEKEGLRLPGPSMVWQEKAMYRDIESGFCFGLPRKGG